jgi:hypothetical protein
MAAKIHPPGDRRRCGCENTESNFAVRKNREAVDPLAGFATIQAPEDMAARFRICRARNKAGDAGQIDGHAQESFD